MQIVFYKRKIVKKGIVNDSKATINIAHAPSILFSLRCCNANPIVYAKITTIPIKITHR